MGAGLLPGAWRVCASENGQRARIEGHEKLGGSASRLFRAFQWQIRAVDGGFTSHLACSRL